MQEPDNNVENGAPASPVSPIHEALPTAHVPPSDPSPAPARQSIDEAAKKAVDSVLYSDIGVSTLLNRLKQSIASVKDFSSFLKKRSTIEDEHAKELRRLCKTTHQDIRKADSRQGSYARQFEAVTNLHERMAENGLQFALNLHQMHEDLNTLAFEMEKGRKNWKQIGLSAEQKATDAEKQMEKAKQKYDQFAEQYDHARTGDGGKHFGLRGMKSAEQREEELKAKVEMSDKDYQAKVQYARQQRQELLNTTRPQAIKALEDLITECDAGLTLQMQKFATFNERLMLANGLLVSPLNEPNAPHQPSMRELIMQIDNLQDFQVYVRSFGAKIPPRGGEIEYKQHPSLAPKGQPYKPPEQQQPSFQPAAPPKDQSPTQYSPAYAPGPVQPPPAQAPSSFPMQQYGASVPENQAAPSSPKHGFNSYNNARNSYDRGDLYGAPAHPPAPAQVQAPPPGSTLQQASAASGYGPPPNPAYPGQQPYGRSPYPSGPSGPPVLPPVAVGPPASAPRPSTREGRSGGAPAKPVFGLSLDELFRRDQSPVPLIVYQCIQAVDLFGLDHEGIYRIPGNMNQVAELKSQFDHNAERVNFQNPEAFFHDVNNAAHLLKMFFRELSDPLFTSEHYNELIEAAKVQDDIVRRDSLHAIINALPDPNYATLRALTLHLHRVVEHGEANRMTSSTLAVIFAPTLMGPHHGPMADASMQPKVIETVIQNALQIFDED
ncbi:uncharacterized protein PV09_04740 [Verruconis gallopava]|uniref:Rho-GAP domain-containing protein n=1 Tax=Verruconis gallopava TaxID=253628 RepID=A0A0D1YTC5_9PEZI|nr:uncharacterized protein PV09_04740 [Verruconis gallopava]KIW03897.1 hypothetical protein PV09_04740 [Verruconis gallopava]